MSLSGAISRLQALVLACTSVSVKAAPDYPTEDNTLMPLAIAHIMSGDGQCDNATMVRLRLTVGVDVHFSAASIKQAYTQITALIPEFIKRVSADPTLNGNCDTVIFPMTYEVTRFDWAGVDTMALRFVVPIKLLDEPQS